MTSTLNFTLHILYYLVEFHKAKVIRYSHYFDVASTVSTSSPTKSERSAGEATRLACDHCVHAFRLSRNAPQGR